jgi:CHAT domain-containing protein
MNQQRPLQFIVSAFHRYIILLLLLAIVPFPIVAQVGGKNARQVVSPNSEKARRTSKRYLRDKNTRVQKTYEAKVALAEAVRLANSDDAEELTQAVQKLDPLCGVLLRMGHIKDAAAASFSLGEVQEKRGKVSEAISSYKFALKLQRENRDWIQETATLKRIGLIYQRTGDYKEAVRHFERAIRSKESLRNSPGAAEMQINLAMLYIALGDTYKARSLLIPSLYVKEGLLLRVELPSPGVLYNNGVIHLYLGNYKEAIEYFLLSLYPGTTIRRQAEVESSIGIARQLIEDERLLGRSPEQQRSLSSGIRSSRDICSLCSKELLNMSEILGGRRSILRPPGSIFGLPGLRSYYDTDEYQQQWKRFIEIVCPRYLCANESRVHRVAVESWRIAGDMIGEARGLTDYGFALSREGKIYESNLILTEALTKHSISGSQAEAARTLAYLMHNWKSAGNHTLAAMSGKLAVNLIQDIRLNVKSINELLQRSYIRKNEWVYRELADILISMGRIPEAEQVLEMLKEEEYFGFIRRNEKMAAMLKARVKLTEAEAKAIAEYERLGDRLTALGSELAKFDKARLKLPETMMFPQQGRYDELKTQIAAAIQSFEVFQRQLAEEFGEENVRVREIESGLQASLQSWGLPGTVIVYTIAARDRLYVIVTTPQVQEPHYTEIKAEELNKLVAQFSRALTNPNIDPRPVGQKLYELLVKPLEADLKGAEAKTLLWSLDGVLRYVPIAALWDGKQYLAERFDNVMIALASRDKLAITPQPVGKWRGLGVGVSQPWREFPALPAVPAELKFIIRQGPASAQERGVLPGRRLLDGEFTRAALERALGRYSVIHVASHFSFQPGLEKSSFLLLGDGSPYPLEAISASAPMFTGVELLTLSTCDTARAGGADGREIESFGMLAQKQGALAVIATLWAVADESTGLLMREFYRLRLSKPELTKAEALRRAQLALLRGELKSSEVKKTGAKRAVLVGVVTKESSSFKAEPNAPYAHPYYWAPFILIGNWR